MKPFFASDYAGIIEGMRFNKVQVAWYGNKSAMEAVDRADGEIFVQSVPKGGEPGYWSVILVPKDSPIQTVDELLTCDKTKSFGLGDVNSTSGYLVPMTFVFATAASIPRPASRRSPMPITRPTRSRSPTVRWMPPPTTPRTWR